MQERILAILLAHGVLSLATNRPDGWPQVTTISYVSSGMILYGLVSRSSQKLRNVSLDDRVSICIGSEATKPNAINGLSMSARANELRDEPYRSEMLACLSARHPGYFEPDVLDLNRSALLRFLPQVISIIDFSKGLGHTDLVTIGAAQTLEMTAAHPDDWGANPKGADPTPRRVGTASSAQ
jgi:nitroimidazol reductase NimA-like FMN-containing flavoprotein (pyridoxamine 5'-phosphate oxidase superfamily)